MKTNIATNRKQSDRLLRCGVSADTADMCWHTAIVPRGGSLTSMPEPSEEWDLWAEPYDCMPEELQAAKLMEDYNEIQPAWSLSALLELLPKEICDDCGDSFYFYLSKEFPFSEEYGAAYIPCWHKGDAIVRKSDNNSIEACVQLIEWLVDNNYKLNKQ